MRHMPFAVTAGARERWMQLMNQALEEAGFPSDVDRLLREFFHGVWAIIINRIAESAEAILQDMPTSLWWLATRGARNHEKQRGS